MCLLSFNELLFSNGLIVGFTTSYLILCLENRYAYAVSSALHDVGNILYKDFMIQVR